MMRLQKPQGQYQRSREKGKEGAMSQVFWQFDIASHGSLGKYEMFDVKRKILFRKEPHKPVKSYCQRLKHK